MNGNRYLTEAEQYLRFDREAHEEKAILRDIIEAVVLLGILGLVCWWVG